GAAGKTTSPTTQPPTAPSKPSSTKTNQRPPDPGVDTGQLKPASNLPTLNATEPSIDHAGDDRFVYYDVDRSGGCCSGNPGMYGVLRVQSAGRRLPSESFHGIARQTSDSRVPPAQVSDMAEEQGAKACHQS
ncbi:hypothetical protein, partial [Dactylosporangium darangshiense]|uniref:hypothetical protein n=1 Tax=Dactylosporangium darangshiense TaxID=579108 RepID=UPI0031ED9D0D